MMQFRQFIWYILMLFSLNPYLYSQPNRFGVPIITNYEHFVTGGSEQNWSITQDNRGVMYFGNEDKGVLEYDGVEWRHIPISNNSRVLSLTTGDDGVIYVGAVEEFGYLAPDCYGNMHFQSLVSRIHVTDSTYNGFSAVYKTYYSGGHVYFCSLDKIFKYFPDQDSIQLIKATRDALFSFLIDHELFTCDYGLGILKLVQDTFVSIPGGDFFVEKNVSGLVKFDSTRFFVATFSNGVYLLDFINGTVNRHFVDQKLDQYLRNGVIYYATDLNKDFVLADGYQGLTILDRDGRAREIITEVEGLLDQQVPYVYTNKQMKGSAPVWIANFQGISKIETNNPFRVFTEKSGFEGFISDIKYFDDNLYISTSTGLFYKESNSTGTNFVRVQGVQDQVWMLHHFISSSSEELLLAVSNSMSTFVIDENNNISTFDDIVINNDNKTGTPRYYGFSIASDPKNSNIVYLGSKENVFGLEYRDGVWKEVLDIKSLPDELRSLAVDKYNYLWAGSINGGIIRYDLSQDPDIAQHETYTVDNGLPTNNKNQIYLHPETGEVLIGTMNGIYYYDYKSDTLLKDTVFNSILPKGRNIMMAMHRDFEKDLWMSFENDNLGWMELVIRKSDNTYKIIHDKTFQRLPNSSTDIFYSNPVNGFWFAKSNELYHFDKSFVRNDTLPFHTLIRNVYINNDSLLYNGTCYIDDGKGGFTIYPVQAEDTQPYIKYRYNNIEFRWAAPFFEQEDQMLYSFWLEPFEPEWSDWTEAVYKDFTNLPHGQYTMHVKAKNVYGDISIPAHYTFDIARPWYATFIAYLAYIILAGFTVYIIIKLYTRRLKQENIRLEGIIQERTAEIRKQKEELTDSIEYASRIQRALLPQDRLFHENGIRHFILFRPRDIVSGDFYWMGQKENKLFVVAADCTGHGVPGAFMSMLGISFLDEIVIKSELTDTNLILDSLRSHVITSLKQTGKSMEESTKDGMDLAMIALDLSTGKIQFSGAYNPLYYVRKLTQQEKEIVSKGEEIDLPRGALNNNTHLLYQIKGDQMPIGISEKPFEFTASEIEGQKVSLYMFTDGFLDQFGGDSGKKFMSKNFKKLILEIQKFPIEKQGVEMERVLNEWMGNISQIDDILVMGLQIN